MKSTRPNFKPGAVLTYEQVCSWSPLQIRDYVKNPAFRKSFNIYIKNKNREARFREALDRVKQDGYLYPEILKEYKLKMIN